MDRDEFEFEAELWLHEGEAPWHFITVPGDVSDDIHVRAVGKRAGFGSVRVRATIGTTTWATSVFPDATRRAHVLPVKEEIRQRKGISAGSRVSLRLELGEGLASGSGER